ncbi:hypothetical protein HQ563_04665 [bacterium]|nr:hypothetical protein [bacterium]
MGKRLLTLISVVGILVVAGVARAEEQAGLFPLGRSWAGDRELPRPFGIGLNFYHQEQDYHLTSLTVNLPNVGLAEAAGVGVENTTNEVDVKADLWLLPFLNVFAIVGDVDGETTVDPGPPLSELEVDYEGLVYGGGLTLAAGGKLFFGSVTMVLTGTELDTSSSSVEAWVLMPRFGVHVGRMAFWVGAMYQEAEERHSGHISLPFFGNVNYDVELEEKEPWNYLVGLSAGISKHWNLELEGGFGDREHVVVSVGYRF